METTEKTIDQEKLNAFLGKVLSDFGAAIGSTLTLIGDKLGFFKAMAFAGPMDSEQLAKKTGANERYIREWLINQAAGGYLEYDPLTKKYILPDEYAIAMTDESSPFYVVGGFQVIGGMVQAQDRVINNFKSGKGMLWGEHHHDLFQGTERFFKPGYHANLVSSWLPSLGGVVDKLNKGALVADVGCGHGISTIIMAKAFPKSKFFGFDNHKESIEQARKIAEKEGVSDRVKFEAGSAQDFNTHQYDLICFFDCLHDMGDPVGALKNCKSKLKDDGTIMAVEPMAGKNVEDNFNAVGRIYSGASVMCCSPNAMASGGYVLGTVATDEALQEVTRQAGLTKFRRATETPFNRIFEFRK